MSFSLQRIFKVSSFSNTSWLNSDKHAIFSRSVHICYNLAARVAFKLSDIGEGIKEVIVKEWYVNVGDKVSQFDNICEVQSDKASVTITSRYDGTVKKLCYAVDDIALVGQPLVEIETDQTDEDEQLQTPIIQEEPEKVVLGTEKDVLEKYLITSDVFKTSPLQENPTAVLCIPSVRRLAKEHKINLSTIKGTGKNGRILKEDILEYITKKPDIKSPTPTQNTVQQIKGFQKVMVKTMTESSKIPTFVYGDEIRVTELSNLRRSLKNLPELKDLKLSFMPFFIKAVSNALQRYPILNASVDENCENVIYHKNHNIGIAMDTKIGLAVPVIKSVENLNIVEIARELNRLIESGRNGSFLPNDMTEGTFAISNIGAIGGSYMKPLILPPQVAIVALGAAQVLPRFDRDKNVIAEDIVNISGAADHRIIDGATMARFTQVLKKQIENPYLLFLNL